MAAKCWFIFTKWDPDPAVAQRKAAQRVASPLTSADDPDLCRKNALGPVGVRTSQPFTGKLEEGQAYHIPVCSGSKPKQYVFAGYVA